MSLSQPVDQPPPPRLAVDISIADDLPAGDGEIPEPELIQQWASVAYPGDHNQQVLPATVSIHIAGSDEVQRLNAQFRQKDGPTNVLSFPLPAMDEAVLAEINTRPLGDIVLCAPVITQEARAQGKTTAAHWAHMVIHGLLHLQGFDHLEPAQADEMEQLEITCLNQLGFSNPYE